MGVRALWTVRRRGWFGNNAPRTVQSGAWRCRHAAVRADERGTSHREATAMGSFGTAGYATPSGWFPDPTGRHEARFWDGAAWTDHIADGGVTGVDPPTPAPPTLVTALPADERRPSGESDPF